MIGLLNWLWTAFLKVFGLARTNTMIDLEGDGSVSDPALVNPVDQSEEGSNWRGAPVYYAARSSRDPKAQNGEGYSLRRRNPWIADGD